MDTVYSENNQIIMVGKVTSDKRFSHEIYGEKFYIFDLSVPRLSGNSDIIPITISERLMVNGELQIGTKITDQIYCNDRTVSTSDVAYSPTNYTTLTSWNSTGTNYYYGANGRVFNNPVSPDYKCPVASDKFTTTTAKGNGKLSYPVGLITADEITFAGLPAGKTNNSFYLYTGDYYWAGSPNGFNVGYAIEFDVVDGGYLGSDRVHSNGGVRGVVSLSSESKLLGSGTYNDVYTVN